MATAEIKKDDDGFISSVDVVDLTDKLGSTALKEKEDIQKRTCSASQCVAIVDIIADSELVQSNYEVTVSCLRCRSIYASLTPSV